MKKLMLVVLAFIVSFGLTIQGNTIVEAKEKITSFSGEQLFAGLFFAQGEVARKLSPKLYSTELLALANTPEAQSAAQDIIVKMKKADESFFQDFKRAIDSNNPIEIQKALNNGSDLLIIAYEDMGIPTNDLESLQAGSATGQCLFVGLVAVFYAALVAQAAVGIVYVAGGAVYFYAAAVQTTAGAVSKAGDIGSLSNEVFVKNIVTML